MASEYASELERLHFDGNFVSAKVTLGTRVCKKRVQLKQGRLKQAFEILEILF